MFIYLHPPCRPGPSYISLVPLRHVILLYRERQGRVYGHISRRFTVCYDARTNEKPRSSDTVDGGVAHSRIFSLPLSFGNTRPVNGRVSVTASVGCTAFRGGRKRRHVSIPAVRVCVNLFDCRTCGINRRRLQP